MPVAATVAPERPQPTRNCQWQGWLEKGGMEGVGRVVKLQQRPVVQKRTPLSCEKGGRSGRDGEEKPGSASPTAASPSPSSPSPPNSSCNSCPETAAVSFRKINDLRPFFATTNDTTKVFFGCDPFSEKFFSGAKTSLRVELKNKLKHLKGLVS